MSVSVKHNGIITKVTSSSIDVSIEEDRDRCSGCAVSGFCGSRSDEKLSVVSFYVGDYDLSSYKIGDRVDISFSGITQLHAAILVMGIPSLLLLAGVLLSLYAGLSQGVSVVLGLLVVIIYFFSLYKVRNIIRSRLRWTLLGKNV